jgi:hypothetical protein
MLQAAFQQPYLTLAQCEHQEMTVTADQTQQRTDGEVLADGPQRRQVHGNPEGPVPAGTDEQRQAVAHVLPSHPINLQGPRWCQQLSDVRSPQPPA